MNEPQQIGESQIITEAHGQTTAITQRVSNPIPISNWRGSITTFKGFTGTIPLQEIKYVTWQAIQEVIAPPSPAILADKGQGKFFIPCALKSAPLVGNTLDAAMKNGLPIIGKMRSKIHVTEATLLVIDIDGLPVTDFEKAIARIKSDHVTFLAYTTHSHGRENKPGMRARVVIPLDSSLDIENYSAAWHGLDQLYFSGHAGKADSSGANLYQQQGTWCAHPDRVALAKCWTARGGIASADYLIANSGSTQFVSAEQRTPSAKTISNHISIYTDDYPPSDAIKIADACQQIGEFRDTKGVHQSEPIWFDCLGIVGFCINGDELCHDWSSGHFGYDVRKTDLKLANRMRMPPTTCAQFMKTSPDGCDGCIQKCRSPITLGWDDAFVVVETEVVA